MQGPFDRDLRKKYREVYKLDGQFDPLSSEEDAKIKITSAARFARGSVSAQNSAIVGDHFNSAVHRDVRSLLNKLF